MMLTLALVSYNQAEFIEEAIQGAFAQTYSPLQIILSDDRSTDGTFEIMSQIASKYSGPHEVLLNQSRVNAGLASHINHIFTLARGELVLMNAGDDVSLPHRATIIANAWTSTGRCAGGVHSEVVSVDRSGAIFGHKPSTIPREPVITRECGLLAANQFLREERPVILGCTAAWSPQLFEQFGPLPENVVFEDVALGFRARLLGGMVHVNEPLVLYRLHDANIHNAPQHVVPTLVNLRKEEVRRQIGLQRRVEVVGSFKADLATARAVGIADREELCELGKAVEGYGQAFRQELAFRQAAWTRRLVLYLRLSNATGTAMPWARSLSHQLLPRWLYYGLRQLKYCIRNWCQRPLRLL